MTVPLREGDEKAEWWSEPQRHSPTTRYISEPDREPVFLAETA